ncbi:MAG: hypothetical protein FJY17_00945 [Bacteroidetes bacterium]|nr:hypothetical protein [Bacteroidota bacterium]
MNKELPIYRLDIVDDLESNVEVEYVALVDRPAIERAFLAFNKSMAFAIQDEEEKIISGALILADTPIYRNDTNGEYYVIFTKTTIKKIVQKYFKKGYQNNVNLMHDSGQTKEGVTMFESWIVDEKRGIKPMVGFEDVKDGSWFGSFKVENDEVWKLIKDGKVQGFSVEGIFNYKTDTKEEKMMKDIIDILRQTK